jgi:hypothetical protein
MDGSAREGFFVPADIGGAVEEGRFHNLAWGWKGRGKKHLKRSDAECIYPVPVPDFIFVHSMQPLFSNKRSRGMGGH